MTDLVIKNCPADAWDYEFIIVYQENKDYIFYDTCTSGWIADQIAKEINGIVIHNVRVQGKRV